MELEEIRSALTDGRIDPQAAVDAFEIPARHISEIPIDDLAVDILPCGFASLDDAMVFKRNRGELLILGARPSMGKSAFLFQIAAHVAQKNNVLIFSLEMDAESIKARMIAAESAQALTKIQQGKACQEKINEANARLSKLKYYIDDRSGLDVRTIVSAALAHNRRDPLSFVAIDYLQLMNTRQRGNRNEEVGDICAQLKSLAKALKCPVMVASQLNRECERRGKMEGDFMPIMSDLRDSGNIEQDADAILFLSRPGIYKEGGDLTEAELAVAKARNGQIGRFKFKFLVNAVKFEDQKIKPAQAPVARPIYQKEEPF